MLNLAYAALLEGHDREGREKIEQALKKPLPRERATPRKQPAVQDTTGFSAVMQAVNGGLQPSDG